MRVGGRVLLFDVHRVTGRACSSMPYACRKALFLSASWGERVGGQGEGSEHGRSLGGTDLGRAVPERRLVLHGPAVDLAERAAQRLAEGHHGGLVVRQEVVLHGVGGVDLQLPKELFPNGADGREPELLELCLYLVLRGLHLVQEHVLALAGLREAEELGVDLGPLGAVRDRHVEQQEAVHVVEPKGFRHRRQVGRLLTLEQLGVVH